MVSATGARGELARELRDHLELEAEEQRAAGLSSDEAGHAAHRALGNVLRIEEEVRAAWGFQWMEALVQDLRYGVRSWRKRPLLSAQFFATVAVGMGAVTALVSLMLALGYEPLPFRDPGRLVAVWERVETGAQVAAVSGPDLTDFANATRSIFSALGGFATPRVWMFDSRGAREVGACYIEASAFSDLGIRPALGREVRPDDAPIGSVAGAPVWISYRLWESRYGGSSAAIGMTIGIASSEAGSDQVRLRIAGVVPPGVNIPLPFRESETDIWYLMPRDIGKRSRQGDVFFGVGRLRPGISAEQAQAALAVVAEHLGQRYFFDRRKRPVVRGLEAIAQGPARQTMWLLSLGVGLVFLVACVNLAVLMGAEGRRRRREIAVRAALGADRWRLWREVAAEKCLLTLLSLGAGIGFASGLLGVLTQMVPAAGLGPPLEVPPRLNLAVLLWFAVFAIAVALVWSAKLVGAADVPGSSRVLAAGGGLGYVGQSDSDPGSGRWRLVLLAAQAGTGVCLLAAAALTARTYAALSVADLGPAPRQTVLLSIGPRDNVVLTDAQAADFNQQVLARLARLPGTQAVALADPFPPLGWPASFAKQGGGAGEQRYATWPVSISPGYFRTLGIPILFGRGFGDTDNSGGELVAIVSMDVAKRNWTAPKDAVGSQIAFGPKHDKYYTIVGVAADFTGYWSREAVPTVYLPEKQSGEWCGEAILRTAGSARTVAALAGQVLAGMATPVMISDVSTMQDRWQARLTRPLARMAGMILLALLGLSLGAQGVYAVAAGTVMAQRHDLAVRSALGALPGDLAWNATRGLVLAVVVGAGLGVAVSLELRPLLEHWLGPVAVWQAEPIAAAVVLLALAAAVGCYVPARAAARANPAEVLREG